jgi:hypothetical protein
VISKILFGGNKNSNGLLADLCIDPYGFTEGLGK